MSTPFFRFKQFIIRQEKCAMKVGTDGTLLGAWARGGSRILDIGTGTGLIALMMAQRHEEATITAIDIDEGAAMQAAENVAASPFADRIIVMRKALQEIGANESLQTEESMETFDSIVCNPPYFENGVNCPDGQRNEARHTATLTFGELMRCAYRLLDTQHGRFSLVVPSEAKGRIEEESIFAGFYLSRICRVITKTGKPPKRYLLEFTKTPQDIEQTELALDSEEYRRLTADFYL